MTSNRDLEDLMRTAMHHEADLIDPADHLQDIIRRTARSAQARSRRRRGWIIGLAGAGLVAATVTSVVWVADQTGGRSPHDAVVSPPPPVNVSVFYVQDNGAGKYPVRIFPEQHLVISSGNIGFDAVSALFTTPPTDRDYSSLWASGSVESVTHLPGLITVDLSANAATTGRHDDVALEQIVYTVQRALDSHDPVRILISGGPPAGASEPLQAAPAHEIEGAIIVDTPSQGATVQSPVTVRGSTSVYEGTVTWEIVKDGRIVKHDFTTALSGQELSPYSFKIDLDPGSYTLRVYDASGGSPMFVETKQFTVE
jgi:Immunoglobulin-like domain of bacterial spore germination/Sporulation and spore germination